jgi:hypothetical protein
MFDRTTQRRVAGSGSAITLMVALLACSVPGLAQPTQSTSSTAQSQFVGGRLTDLEDAFWLCDYIATTHGASDIHACSAIYAALKHRKFGGDFDGLVEWWGQNKREAHKRAHELTGASHSANPRPR